MTGAARFFSFRRIFPPPFGKTGSEVIEMAKRKNKQIPHDKRKSGSETAALYLAQGSAAGAMPPAMNADLAGDRPEQDIPASERKRR